MSLTVISTEVPPCCATGFAYFSVYVSPAVNWKVLFL